MTREQHKRADELQYQEEQLTEALQTIEFGDTVWVSTHDTRHEESRHIELDNITDETFCKGLREFVKEHLQQKLNQVQEEYANL